MSWSIKITVLYLSFVAMILSLVFMSMREKVDLVSKDYYADELKYQSRIKAIENGAAFENNINASYQAGIVSIEFPKELTDKKINGNIHLYRPSDSGLDKKEEFILTNNTSYSFKTEKLTKGLYKIKISWAEEGKDFFVERPLFINKP